MINDPIGDFLARIKNAITQGKTDVEAPASKMLTHIAEILQKEGFIASFKIAKAEPQNKINVELKYVNGESAIRGIKRMSKPGRRIYIGYGDIKRVKDGYGIAILSTPQGVMTGSQARKLKVAGEYLCEIY